jgi:uncharacterized repeat protein (TIGR01451 family)
MSDSEFEQVTEQQGKKNPAVRVSVGRGAVTALVVGVLLVVAAGLGATASGGLRAQKTAFAPLRLNASPLSIGLRVTPRTAIRGQTVTYLLRISNVSGAPARVLRVCDQVPLRMILVSAPPGFVGTHHRLECRTFPSLPVGGTAIFNFQMKVSPTARGGVVINTAYARARGMVSFIYAQVPLTIGVKSPCGAGPAC